MQGPYIKVTSDAMKIKVSTVVIQYCVYFDFHCIRCYLSLRLHFSRKFGLKTDEHIAQVFNNQVNKYTFCVLYLSKICARNKSSNLNLQLTDTQTLFKEARARAQFYIQLVFKAPLCITLTISDQKIVSGSLF